MPIQSARVGADLGTREFDVTPRNLLAYAAALGATDLQTFDDAAEGFAGLPQFCVVAEWPWASDPAMRGHLGLSVEESRRALHVGQDSVFQRPIRAGTRLRVSGRLVDVRPVRTGALTVSRIELADARTNEGCVTSWTTALFPGVQVEGDRATTEARPGLPFDARDIAAGEPVEVAIPREAPHIYTECSGIWNPIHTERRVALAMGLPDIVLHGTATWAIAGRELVRLYAAGDATRLRRLAGDFRAMVIPGTTIRIEHGAAATSPTIIRFTVFNSAGETAIADGLAEFATRAR
jgi:acyl dehydratase